MAAIEMANLMKKEFWDSRILLVRHGEAMGNTRGAFLGRRDDALTEQGQAQAAQLCNLLAHETIDTIYTSPMKRAACTATPFARARGLSVEARDELLEQDYGAWDGMTFGEVQTRYPDDYKAWWRDGLNHPPTGGETLACLTARVAGFYESCCRGKPGTIVLVGHAGAFQALLCVLFEIPTRSMWPFRLQNGSITEVQFIRGQASLTRLSVT